ncbi:65-kDa microtubule-associated protein 1-like isoform X1 [Asparagus officinalis]|uniref:65-kDa microtubule-associated protein 1-like isoform X1 n=1 Tax=Asparagus officinalis TaxID=4686 RepID=UPI00098E0070|nr:65-kDa microtubule-associated protein 1-like isoform X1 [Asparagus officinalis]
MTVVGSQSPLMGETTCGSLLQQLQIIWDEVGESDEERDKLLLQLEQECLDVYRRKVDQAAKSRALLLQALADSRSELSRLLAALGEETCASAPDKSSCTIKEQLEAIAPALELLRKQKEERVHSFADVQSQIRKIQAEIVGNLKLDEHIGKPQVDEDDLSLKKLDEFQSQLLELQKEKSDRLHKVLDFVSNIHALCSVLGMDFFSTINEVHPSLDDSISVQSKSISNETLSKLSGMVGSLVEDKKLRLQKLQELVAQLTDLWNLMDTPVEERNLFNHIIYSASASVDDVTVPGALALDLIEQVRIHKPIFWKIAVLEVWTFCFDFELCCVKAEVEVERLDSLKASKMKEIAMKRQSELEDIYAHAHIEVDPTAAREKIMALIETGNVEPSELLADMDSKISKAKEEAFTRKEILERVEKWMSACEEESWLEDYNRDENRYSSSRGAHLNLKRAEKARVLLNKIPALVDNLVAKTKAWEADHGITFTYDGVSLLAMLDEYTMLRHEREEEKRRMRDQKKFTEQMNTEQEALFGSRPSPARPVGPKKAAGPRVNGTPNRRQSMSANQNGSNGVRSASRDGRRDSTNRPAAPVNYVAIAKEDTASHISSTDPIPASP